MTKAKYWEGILYPENMVSGWQDIIGTQLEFPYAYCIHNKDLLKDTEESRKEHVHCIIAYPAPTTGKQILKLFNRLSEFGKTCCSVVQDKYNIRGAYNYLIHDTEESRKAGKFQYDPSLRIEGNNFDIGLYEQLSQSEKEDMVDELCAFILEQGITNYADFYLTVREKYDKGYVRLIKTYSGHFERLIKGVYHKAKEAEEKEKVKSTSDFVKEIERMQMMIDAQKEYIERLKMC